MLCSPVEIVTFHFGGVQVFAHFPSPSVNSCDLWALNVKHDLDLIFHIYKFAFDRFVFGITKGALTIITISVQR